MSNICDCYKIRKQLRHLTEFEKWELFKRTGVYKENVEEEVGVCFGTKECYECTCNGDRTECDFYDYVRDITHSESEDTSNSPSNDSIDVIYKYIDKYKDKSELDNKIVKVLEEVLEEIKGERLR